MKIDYSSRAGRTGVALGWGVRNVQLEPAGSAKRGLEMARRIWMSAAGSANMEVSSAGEANREPELSCKTCLKRTLKRAPTLRHPYFNGIGRVGRRRPERAVEHYERNSEAPPTAIAAPFP